MSDPVNTDRIDFGAIDYSDPCAVLEKLRPCYYQLLAGSKPQEVTFDAGNGTAEKVIFHKSDLSRLAGEISRLETLCKQKTSSKPSRHAIRIGGVIR